MSRFVDGILVGIGIGLIVLAGGIYFVMYFATQLGQENATTSQTGSQWVIVVEHSGTTVTETATVPSVGQYVTHSASASWFLSMFEVVGFIGAMFILIGILPPKNKTPAPSNV